LPDALPSCAPVRVVRGVEASQARRVAELFYLSFGAKLAGLVLPRDREAGIDLLAHSLCLGEVYAALDEDGEALGVALVTGHGRLLEPDRDALVRAFGRFGGAWRWTAYRLLSLRRRTYPGDQRGLEGFSVDPACRGRGVGSAMVERIIEDARAEGARAIELSVGDTNPARHLYERAGFEATRTGGVGLFARRLGFKRLVYYELRLRGECCGHSGAATSR
jgi:ribosomal protein S18 acetylase RimI-like enzyme